MSAAATTTTSTTTVMANTNVLYNNHYNGLESKITLEKPFAIATQNSMNTENVKTEKVLQQRQMNTAAKKKKCNCNESSKNEPVINSDYVKL